MRAVDEHGGGLVRDYGFDVGLVIDLIFSSHSEAIEEVQEDVLNPHRLLVHQESAESLHFCSWRSRSCFGGGRGDSVGCERGGVGDRDGDGLSQWDVVMASEIFPQAVKL